MYERVRELSRVWNVYVVCVVCTRPLANPGYRITIKVRSCYFCDDVDRFMIITYDPLTNRNFSLITVKDFVSVRLLFVA